ncbi:killer cell lectin-like receptor subfamily F member 1 isoform X2 [Colius striatus]|uniref:killer cell lectin-like receptor subfamily F member 1 isoform X2 n=1 Tax=Colius striatus TaxID=57412 RepID=UPI002B1E396A|nr:killer cell lectin-like receptor subfamily F member 1 isoform X2 [Colius striatus]
MAGDITYVDVAMLPRERPHAPSQTSVPGNVITYAELRMKPKHKGNSRSETSASGCQHRCSAWFYVALVLGVLVLVLIGIIAVLAEQQKIASTMLLKWLMKELCEDGQATTCELCPPGWQLHRGRCYYFSEKAVNWDDSQRNCLARKSQLLVIEDENEMEFIDHKERGIKYIWIELKVQNVKKQQSSAEDPGAEENRIAMKRIEDDKNCAVYRRKNIIQTDNCHTLKKWICKRNATLLVL